MVRRKTARAGSRNPAYSSSTTPASSAYPSTYPSEVEGDTPDSKAVSSFPFMLLPLELRNKVYGQIFSRALPDVLDLDPQTFEALRARKALALFKVSRQVHLETTCFLFGTNTFRLFPIHPGRYFKTKRPLLARLPARYRSLITSLELRLGPGWADPPRGWVVNDALGLCDCTSVRVLKILVECDPSDAIFKGFRRGDGFYERFCESLLHNILKAVPSIEVVQFDAWSSVKRDGAMLNTLESVVLAFHKETRGLGEKTRYPLPKLPALASNSVIAAWA